MFLVLVSCPRVLLMCWWRLLRVVLGGALLSPLELEVLDVAIVVLVVVEDDRVDDVGDLGVRHHFLLVRLGFRVTFCKRGAGYCGGEEGGVIRENG